MKADYDLVIRGGTVVDGNGGSPFEADVAVASGLVVAIGRVAGSGREEIDARGIIVTPGFIDIHTHYDGQATWEARMQPSSGHGVTTVIGGNCGVGFAPCRPGERQMLVKLMEGVEDVPEVVMTAGLPWAWETFPDYLDFLEDRRFDVDVGLQVPHSPIRVFVMGERGARREPATTDDIARMSELVEEGVRAGAFGVSTSRFLGHRTKAGEIAPSVEAADAELMGLAEGLRRAGAGVFQLIPAVEGDPAEEFSLMRDVVTASGRPLSFSLLAFAKLEAGWRQYLDLLDGAQPAAAPIRGQVYPRPVGLLYGLDLSFHHFSLNPSYRVLADLPLSRKLEEMRKPEVRARLLSESPDDPNPFAMTVVDITRDLYVLGDPPRYDPPIDQEIGRQAALRGMSKAELIYDLLLEDEGRKILFHPASNFPGNSLSAAGALMRNPNTVVALGDGGAHYGMICDGSYPTFMLTHWVRDAPRDQRMSLAAAVKSLTSDPAAAVGLTDRGRIAVGMKADINVIDLDKLTLRAPTSVYNLPGNGRRLQQCAQGYRANIVSGEITYLDGESTGALPGRLVRRTH